MEDVLKFSLPGNPEYIQVVKLAVGSVAGLKGFSIEAVEDIQIAVAEACKNITCHGAEGFSALYEIKCQSEEKKIIITVTDLTCDKRIEKDKKPCLDCPKEGDLGIYIIKSLVDQVEIVTASQGNKSIKMVKNIC